MKQILQRLFGDERLTSDQTRAIMYEITRQSYPDAQIAAMLTEAEFRTLHVCAESLDLAVLCEAHTREELEMLASNGARIIGINARNLSTFDTSLDRVAELIQRVPERCVAVGESAIRERADLLRLHELGAQAFLIGETLMRAPSPGRKLCELLSK